MGSILDTIYQHPISTILFMITATGCYGFIRNYSGD